MLSDKEQAEICETCVLQDCNSSSPLCKLTPALKAARGRSLKKVSPVQIASVRKWQAKNPEKVKEYKRKWYREFYQVHKDAEIARVKECKQRRQICAISADEEISESKQSTVRVNTASQTP